MVHSTDLSLNAADIKTLKERARALKARLERLERRVSSIQAPGMPGIRIAMVDGDLCAGCGRCSDVCPVRAIELKGKTARVDAARCRGCGLCVDACPQGAVSMQALRMHGKIPKQATG